MAGLLYGWELGGGASHLELARALIEVLPARFDRVAVALRDLGAAHRRFASGRVRLWQAPLASPAGVLPNPASYAEILFESGFHDADALRARLRAWDALIDASAADVIVADHAPTLLLAARGRDVRRSCVGAGFFCPPRVSPLPSFRFWDRVPAGRSADIESRVLATINQVLSDRGQPLMAQVADLFDLDETFLTTVPELDHYGARSGQRYWGFYASGDGSGVKPVWPQGDGPRVFGYLSPDYPRIDELLTALLRLKWPAWVHIAGLPSSVRRTLEGPSLVLSDRWVDMGTAMAGADVVLCHAGAGTMAWALEHGRPLVTLPLHAEQTVAAQRLKEAGLGCALMSADPALLRRALKETTTDTALRARLQAFRVSSGGSALNLQAIGQRLEALLTSSWRT